jgi:lipoprotein signal peptidase
MQSGTGQSRAPTDAIGYAALLLSLALLADIATKTLAVHYIGESPVMFGALTLQVVTNPAFAFSLGEGVAGDGFVPLSRAFGLLLIVAFLRGAVIVDHALRTLSGYALVAAGGLGNTLDHVTQDGAVVDFIGLRPPLAASTDPAIAFNMADIWIFVGLALLYPAIRAFARRCGRRGAPRPA